jgi:hypothetical protein
MMQQPQIYTTWKVTCRSPGDSAALRQWLPDRISPNRILVQTIRTIPNGVEHEESVPHRLGDYFAAVRVLPSLGNEPSFSLVFQRREDAGRYWKDLMVSILQEISASPQRPAIELESKGEIEPDSLVTVR